MPKIILIIIIGIVFFKVKIDKEVGKELDSFNNVKIYFNGFPTKSFGRNLSEDGYNIGMKYQCVEFIRDIILNTTTIKCLILMEMLKISIIKS